MNTSLLYTYVEFDMYIVAGDMNARIGESIDFIKDVDEVDTRRVWDNTINNHGKELINSLATISLLFLEKEKQWLIILLFHYCVSRCVIIFKFILQPK